MNILLTNDDGYNAKGINILKEKLAKYGTVYVFCPTSHMSGASMSFSLGHGFTIKKYNEHEYSVDGTPVDTILVGTQYLKDIKFDLVVSGINDGLNISYDTLYSGTIGATMEALNHSIPAIAISTDINSYEIVDNEIEMLLDYIFDNKLYSDKYVLNINFPINKYLHSNGIKLTNTTFKKDDFYYWYIKDKFYTDRHEHLESVNDINSDSYAVLNGYISISPLINTLFNKEAYEKLKKLIK